MCKRHAHIMKYEKIVRRCVREAAAAAAANVTGNILYERARRENKIRGGFLFFLFFLPGILFRLCVLFIFILYLYESVICFIFHSLSAPPNRIDLHRNTLLLLRATH